jgi:hypothetical protein
MQPLFLIQIVFSPADHVGHPAPLACLGSTASLHVASFAAPQM